MALPYEPAPRAPRVPGPDFLRSGLAGGPRFYTTPNGALIEQMPGMSRYRVGYGTPTGPARVVAPQNAGLPAPPAALRRANFAAQAAARVSGHPAPPVIGPQNAGLPTSVPRRPPIDPGFQAAAALAPLIAAAIAAHTSHGPFRPV